MSSIPVIPARKPMHVLTALGFAEVRIRGSHHRFAHPDGRKTTVPVHAGRDLPRGLLHKIVTEDVGITMEEFIALL